MFNAKDLFIFLAIVFGTENVNSIEIDELCALAPGVTILRPNSCTDWKKCPSKSGAKDMEEGSCVSGLYFDKNNGSCEYEDNVNCPYDTKIRNRCSFVDDGTFLVNEEDCRSYIYCRGGEELKSFCPNHLVFDPNNKACVYRHQYTCPESKPTANVNPLCMSLPDGLSFADKFDCTKYSECKNGTLYTYSCNDNFGWDYLKQVCLPANEVTCLPNSKQPEPELKVCIDHEGPVADGITCSGYYFCKKGANNTYDRRPAHFNCPVGTFFDTKSLSCRDRLNVKCKLDRCEGMGNKYVNVAGDCRAYILCKNGMASTQGICPNDHYFDERTQGCTLQVINYTACAANNSENFVLNKKLSIINN